MAIQWTWYRMDIAYVSRDLAVKFHILNPRFTSVYTLSNERALEINFDTGLSYLTSYFKTAYKYFGMRFFSVFYFNPNVKFRIGNLSFVRGYAFNLGFGDLFKKHIMNAQISKLGRTFGSLFNSCTIN